MASPVRHFSAFNPVSLECWNATNFEYEENPYPMVTLRVPGLGHESFDSKLNPKATSIMMLTSLSRLYTLTKPLPTRDSSGPKQMFLDWPHLTDEFFMFVSCTEFVMTRAMYDKSIQKWPLDVKYALGHVGSCSISLLSEFYACSSEESAPTSRQTLLWTNSSQIVSVNKATRMPARLPGWHQDKYKGKGSQKMGLNINPFDRPAQTFASHLVVPWEDIDFYHHTNWSSYVRWALSALHAALLQQSKSSEGTHPTGTANSSAIGSSGSSNLSAALHGITKEIVSRGVRKLQIIFLRECVEGDHVETHVWQEMGSEKELVWFSVVKNGEDICQIKIWFFEEENKPVPEEEEEEDFPF